MVSGQYEFGAYCLDAQSQMLFREGDHVALPPKVTESPGRPGAGRGQGAHREELLQRLWPDTVVEEGSLTSQISLLRKALGADPKAQDFIETWDLEVVNDGRGRRASDAPERRCQHAR